ncbi:hypothetical protein CYMTET_43575, partial [Cymbomonas tetramitiformis]
ELLEMLGVGPERWEMATGFPPEAARVERLVVPYDVPTRHPPRALLLQLRSLVLRRYAEGHQGQTEARSPPGGRRVVVIRRQAEESVRFKRAGNKNFQLELGNHNALLAELQRLHPEHTFVDFRAGGLNVSEQIPIFRHADVIVGTHGSGLTNMIWAQPNTTVVELSPLPTGALVGAVKDGVEVTTKLHFRNMATALNLQYHMISHSCFSGVQKDSMHCTALVQNLHRCLQSIDSRPNSKYSGVV